MVSNLFRHLLRLPLHWYEKRHVGDILSRFSSTRPIRDLFTEGLVAAFIDGLMAVSTLILIFVYSTVLGTVVLGASGLYLMLRLTFYQPLRQRIEEQIAAPNKGCAPVPPLSRTLSRFPNSSSSPGPTTRMSPPPTSEELIVAVCRLSEGRLPLNRISNHFLQGHR